MLFFSSEISNVISGVNFNELFLNFFHKMLEKSSSKKCELFSFILSQKIYLNFNSTFFVFIKYSKNQNCFLFFSVSVFKNSSSKRMILFSFFLKNLLFKFM
jgi:hypothetical protein